MTKVYYVKDTAKSEILTYQGLPWATPVQELAQFVAWALNREAEGDRYVPVHFKVEPQWPWEKDISTELATNAGPYTSEQLKADNGWWLRTLDKIDKLTFHHTLSHDPYALAKHYVDKEGGRPSMPYTLWVTSGGQVLKCVDLTEGLWHDHTGHENTHLSVGLAGSLHLERPPEAQMRAAARVAAWAIKSPELPAIDTIEDITGHQDWIKTACPGWNSAASGYWKAELFELIEQMLA